MLEHVIVDDIYFSWIIIMCLHMLHLFL